MIFCRVCAVGSGSRVKIRTLTQAATRVASESCRSDSLNISPRAACWVVCPLGRTRGHGRRVTYPGPRAAAARRPGAFTSRE